MTRMNNEPEIGSLRLPRKFICLPIGPLDQPRRWVGSTPTRIAVDCHSRPRGPFQSTLTRSFDADPCQQEQIRIVRIRRLTNSPDHRFLGSVAHYSILPTHPTSDFIRPTRCRASFRVRFPASWIRGRALTRARVGRTIRVTGFLNGGARCAGAEFSRVPH